MQSIYCLYIKVRIRSSVRSSERCALPRDAPFGRVLLSITSYSFIYSYCLSQRINTYGDREARRLDLIDSHCHYHFYCELDSYIDSTISLRLLLYSIRKNRQERESHQSHDTIETASSLLRLFTSHPAHEGRCSLQY